MADMFEVDTAQVRQIADKVKKIASQVQTLADRNVRAMQSTVGDELKGETANAVKDVLIDLQKDIGTIASGLNTVQRALTTYAHRLELADAEIAKSIRV